MSYRIWLYCIALIKHMLHYFKLRYILPLILFHRINLDYFILHWIRPIRYYTAISYIALHTF